MNSDELQNLRNNLVFMTGVAWVLSLITVGTIFFVIGVEHERRTHECPASSSP